MKHGPDHSQHKYRAGSILTVICLLLGLAANVPSADASKKHLFLETFGGSTPPSIQRTAGLVVDQGSGDLLVIDEAGKVLRFHADGTPANFAALGTNVIDAKGSGQCPLVPDDCDQTPQNGFEFGPFGGEQQIAIDESGGPADGDIYVTQGKQEAGRLVDIFDASGEYLGQITSANGVNFGSSGFPFAPAGVAVDSGGALYLSAPYENKIYKYSPSGSPAKNSDYVATFTSAVQPGNLAMGAGPSAGSLFVNSFFSNEDDDVLELDSVSGALEGVIAPREIRMLAVDPVTGHLYALGGDVTPSGGVTNGRVREFDATGFLISSFAGPEGPVGVNEGIAVNGTSGNVYVGNQFTIDVYGPLVTVPDVITGAFSITGDTSVTLEGSVNPDGVALEECFFEYGLTDQYGQSVPCAESMAEIGVTTKEVHADLSGLAPETLYHYRLVAKNANATISGGDRTVKMPSKPAIVGEWSQDVGLSEATLKARVNPENSPTTYRFEWGLDTSYGESTGEIPLGGDNADRTVSRILEGLQVGTTYHYRVVATNNLGVTTGEDRSFSTFPTPLPVRTNCPNQVFRFGFSAKLPDCRAFEMVSPPEKNNGDIAVNPSGPNFPAGLDQGSGDGNTFSYSSSTSFGGAPSGPFSSQYVARRDPGAGWLTHPISPPREGVPIADEHPANIALDRQYQMFSADLTKGWLLQDTEPLLDQCAVPGYINLYRRDDASGDYEALTTVAPIGESAFAYWPAVQGVSEDGTHAVFVANGKLTDDAAGNGTYQVYEHIDTGEGCGELRLVSVLPSGKGSTLATSVGSGSLGGVDTEGRRGISMHAVSTDGSRIFWSTSAEALYVRINGAETLRLATKNATFEGAAVDGSRAVYSIFEAGVESLYEFDVESNTSTLIDDGVHGFAGMSEDASRVYFASPHVLAAGAEAGEPNLYLHEAGGTTSFVATLDKADVVSGPDKKGYRTVGGTLITRGTRTSADGSRFAFVSRGGLTGYDNLDTVSGKPDLEVYLYDAEADELVCVSCNPNGSRPTGRSFGAGTTEASVAAELPVANSQVFAPRALSSDGGRLFFESYEALLLRDSNGRKDVYEWQEADSAEQCVELGAELYVESAAGCLSLISTGQSPTDSEFVDATPSGSDVFIKTGASLLVQDFGLTDIYDARIEGGYPPPPGIPPACEGEACQGLPSAPDDPTPASSAFEGAGNVVEGPVRKSAPHKARKKRKHAKKSKSHKRSGGSRRASEKGRAGR